jgi:hypothetical protein
MVDDDTLARKISTRLTRQPEVPVHVAYELRQARARALMRVGAPRRVWARLAQWPSLRTTTGIALLMLGFVYAAWQMGGAAPDLADLDIELLTGELPPAAYLDPGFVRFVSGTGR